MPFEDWAPGFRAALAAPKSSAFCQACTLAAERGPSTAFEERGPPAWTDERDAAFSRRGALGRDAGVALRISAPLDASVVASPMVLQFELNVTQGAVADQLGADVARWQLCYAVDAAAAACVGLDGGGAAPRTLDVAAGQHRLSAWLTDGHVADGHVVDGGPDAAAGARVRSLVTAEFTVR
ncbi:hypothetical protein M885DRAFT_511946 [Pelagophyceae sp. CCMP2097]|nr:hypothetical protein M885DRAFT_511946 [Pelagophyceae sp. CCMP2097]